MGRMEEIEVSSVQQTQYFIPHNFVLKLESITTKLCVLFDACATSSSGVSLNKFVYVRPKIQENLFAVFFCFTMQRFFFTADIGKVFRLIIVDKSDQRCQWIWQRKNSEETIKCYKLKTVTDGTTSALYLATKCFHRLG